MKANKNHYHAIIEDVNDAIYTTDLKGNFTSVNPAGLRITGYTKEEFLKLHMSAVVSPKHLALVKSMMQKKFDDDLSTVYEIDIIRKDSSKIPVEISSRALYENGEIAGVIGIARDITERKSLEQQKDIFFSLVTHEIKNPLSSIKAFAEMLSKYHEKRNEEKPKHYAEAIDEQVDKLNILVNDFLDISKMNAGTFSYKKEKFDLNTLVTDSVDVYNQGQARNRIRKVGNKKAFVYGDAHRIEQVLNNLIANALKYSPEDSPITIEVIKNSKTTSVHVTDLGPGIPEEKHATIFELFYRLEHHKASSITGHGMGLYVCKQIILGHDGNIWVKSVADEGTTFSFTLPNYQKHYNKISVVHAASPEEAA